MMKTLLKIEWIKLYYSRATRIFIMIYFLILLLIGVILSFIQPEIGGIKLNISKIGTFDFPDVWKNMAYIVAVLKIFIGVIIITNITNEFSNNTLKQNLIDGMSKKEFLKSKILTSNLLAFLSTIFVFFLSLILGLVFSSTENALFHGIEFIAAYFLKLILFFSICLFLALLLKKTAYAFLGLIVLWFGEGAITMIEFFIRVGIEKADNNFFLSHYLPLNTSSKLIEFPQIQLEGFIFGGSVFQFQTINWSFVFSSIIYIVLFTFLSYRILKNRDL